jgi:aspartate racemase
MKMLGIIGGMGTPAGARLVQYLVEEAKAHGAVKDTDFPPFVLYSLPTECLDGTGVLRSKETDLVFSLCYSARKLSDFGCTHLIIACNSAHVFIKEVRKFFSGEVIDMVDLACADAARGDDKIGVMSSKSSRDSGLYFDRLKNLGIDAVDVDDCEQAMLDAAIELAISDRQSSATTFEVDTVERTLEARGVRTVILGCTEIPMLVGYTPRAARYVDPGKLAIRHFIKSWKNTSS